jgi:hypothetical protein
MPDSPGNSFGAESRRVQHDSRFEPLRIAAGEPHAYGAAPVMDHQGEFFYLQGGKKAFQVVDMGLQGIGIFLWFGGKAAAHMVRDNDSVGILQQADKVAVIKGPGRVAVQHDNGSALPLIQKGEGVAAD